MTTTSQSARRARRKRRVALARHRRKCAICRHPDREAIDHDLLHWRSPTDVAEDYDLYDRKVIYRHAHATGIFSRRREQACSALDTIIESAGSIRPMAMEVIHAIELSGQMTDTGRIVPPTKRVIITHEWAPGTKRDSSPAAGATQPSAIPKTSAASDPRPPELTRPSPGAAVKAPTSNPTPVHSNGHA